MLPRGSLASAVLRPLRGDLAGVAVTRFRSRISRSFGLAHDRLICRNHSGVSSKTHSGSSCSGPRSCDPLNRRRSGAPVGPWHAGSRGPGQAATSGSPRPGSSSTRRRSPGTNRHGHRRPGSPHVHASTGTARPVLGEDGASAGRRLCVSSTSAVMPATTTAAANAATIAPRVGRGARGRCDGAPEIIASSEQGSPSGRQPSDAPPELRQPAGHLARWTPADPRNVVGGHVQLRRSPSARPPVGP